MAKHTSDIAHTLRIALVSVIVGIGLFFCFIGDPILWDGINLIIPTICYFSQ